MEINYDLISDVEVEDVKGWDYPDFCDAYISDATYNGEPMSEEMLEELNQDGEFVYEKVLESLY